MGWVSDPFFFYLCFVMTNEEILNKYGKLVDRYLTKPTRISYIQRHIFRCDDLEVKNIINTFVQEGVVQEHQKFKDYYGKKQN